MADAHAAVLIGDALAAGAEGALAACLFCQACGTLVPAPSTGRVAEVDQLECVLTCEAVTASDTLARGFCSPLATACAVCGTGACAGSACAVCGAVAAAQAPCPGSTEPGLVNCLSASLAAASITSTPQATHSPGGAVLERPGASLLAASALRAVGSSLRASQALRRLQSQAGAVRARLTSRCVACARHGRAGILAKPCSSLLGPTLIRPSLTAGLPPQRWWSKRWAAPTHVPRLALLRLVPACCADPCEWAPPRAEGAPDDVVAATAARAELLAEWIACGRMHGAGSEDADPSRDVAAAARLDMVSACRRVAHWHFAAGPAAPARRSSSDGAGARAARLPAQGSTTLPVLALLAVDLRACGHAWVGIAPAGSGSKEGCSPAELVTSRVVTACLEVSVVAGTAGGRSAICEARLPLEMSVASDSAAVEGIVDEGALHGGWSRWRRLPRGALDGPATRTTCSVAEAGGAALGHTALSRDGHAAYAARAELKGAAAPGGFVLQVLVAPSVACEVPLD